MSRGLHAKYRLIKIESEVAYYAYGGSNFSYPYDKTIFNSMDGRLQIKLSLFTDDENLTTSIQEGSIKVSKPCFYAEFNFEGFDIFALKTIYKLFREYKKSGELPKEGMWVV